MKNTKINVSIIIVNYKVEKELISCINSILKSKPKTTHEIIVVDNDKEDKLKTSLKKIFPQVIYIKSKNNLGYGGGNNLGARYAQGKYLFFLNPDTKVLDGALDNLYNFFINNHNVGIISPLFLDNNLKPFKSQGSKELTPKNIIFCQSFLRKIFSNKNIYNENALIDWDLKSSREVSSVPGAAMMVSSNLFRRMEGFDENFFLYFEENDISKRISGLGYKLFIVPSAKIIHLVGRSTKNLNNIENVYSKSRYLYLKKHYGLLKAIFTQMILSTNRTFVSLFLILALAFFLRIINIEKTMPFIGDQGWFYLSARDMLINGQIPLVGIASSHPWLHQGPFWTYLLASFLWIFHFNPVSGAYLTAFLGALSVLMMYLVGSALFSKRVGLLASLFYATSPLIIFYMRLPYHTSPIPFFVLIYIFFLNKVVQGKSIYLPMTLTLLSILYNFEIATSTLGVVLVGVLICKIIKKKILINKILNKKIVILSVIAFITPLLPMILYDVKNGFPQTLKFAAWSLYRSVSLFGDNPQQTFSINKIIIMFNFLFINFTKIIFVQSNLVSLIILLFLIGWVIYMRLKKKKAGSFSLVFLLVFIPLMLVIFNQVPSDAYLPIFFPTIILLLSAFIDFIMNKKAMFIPVSILIIILAAGNINFMLKNDFAFDKPSKLFTLDNRLQAVHQILDITGNRNYNLKGKGQGSQFESFTMNYEYLAWWLGHGPSTNNENLRIYVSESVKGIKIEEDNK